MEMAAVSSVMRFNVAGIFLWVFELSLDDEVRPIRVIRIVLGKSGPVVVASGRSGHVVRVELHRCLFTTNAAHKHPSFK